MSFSTKNNKTKLTIHNFPIDDLCIKLDNCNHKDAQDFKLLLQELEKTRFNLDDEKEDNSIANFVCKKIQTTFLGFFATPLAFVTGVAALIKANFPELSYEQVKNSILASSVKVSSLQGKTLAGGKLDATSAFNMAKRAYEYMKKNPKGRTLAKKK